ncbi:alpha/beta hydrolase [Streptomyces albus]|uniref:alpha/beta hydrolase n=1 Tax=Streptomyces sp. PHES57 TaxID=2872626 RepID=UPI001CEC3AC8|nr:alpha/beta hydrolase-fold protein [Streptomyces sp. PHES57]
MWTETTPPLAAMLPGTRYFELKSEAVGAQFGVWVTTPPRYESETERRYPAIYQPDGNLTAPQTASAMQMLRDDPINPVRPFIQVSVGYIGEDTTRLLAVRARDLLPPGEPLLPTTNTESLDLLVQAGYLDADAAKLYWHNLQNPAADKFLFFLVDELHPLISAEFRVDDASTGLWGFSYGGLFATYAALRRTPFSRIGAGSPGIVPQSKVFELYDSEAEEEADYSGRMLHMTVCEKELTAVSPYQAYIGLGATKFITQAGKNLLSGLTFSSKIIPAESHATGLSASWFSFLRHCYPTSAPEATVMCQ